MVSNRKKIKNGTVKSKKRVSNRKTEKKLQTGKKWCQTAKTKPKKKIKLSPPEYKSRCSACGLGRRLRARCRCSPFAPWVVATVLVAVVHAVGCRCWLLCAAGHAWLGSEVALCVGAWRGRNCVLKAWRGRGFH